MTKAEIILKDLKLSKKRLLHTLGVVESAKTLAKRHFPNLSLEKTEVAALLHDFTKEYSQEEQKELCKKYNIYIPSEEADIQKLYHAKTSAAVAKFIYGVDEETESAIYYHTTGRANMTDAEMILYFADYIEPNRTEKSCVEVREYYNKCLVSEHNHLKALKKSVLFSLDQTIKYLLKDNEKICVATIEARNSLLDYINYKKSNQGKDTNNDRQ